MSACKLCGDPIVLEVDRDEENEVEASSSAAVTTIPDDLEVQCGCHFHWQCFFDEAPQTAVSLRCPSCETYLPTNPPGPSVTNPIFQTPQPANPPVLARYTNEGGVEEGLDLLPRLTEEAYLAAHPEARPGRALHLMCAEGDVIGIHELVVDAASPSNDDDDDDEMADGDNEEGEHQVAAARLSAPALLRYQDPLARMPNALHVAVRGGRDEVVWYLLWFASRLPTAAFPDEARARAAQLGLDEAARKAVQEGHEDIRALRDDDGRTAGDVAARMGGIWEPYVQAGVFVA